MENWKLALCKTCGKNFLQRLEETYCRICASKWRKEQERKQNEIANLALQEQKKKNQEVFERELLKYKTIPIEQIPATERTLYIIGNGFDLMHCVPSSYYSFRDSLGKHNHLRETLELALTPDDIWADFETSLGKQNLGLMGSREIVGMWLENFDAYDEDSGAAEYYMAVEAAANPIISIANSLQPSFRRWVEKLSAGTDDRPLEKIINSNGKALSFNYTEFIETLYGVKDVCYIHGCRKNKREKLILGHRLDAEGSFNEQERTPQKYRQVLVDTAQNDVFDLIARYDEDITKNSREIIKKQRSFFDELSGVKQVVVIGHSMSPVDWDYFSEICKINAHWYFGVFSLNDFRNMKCMTRKLGIKQFSVFRTDGIRTKPNRTAETETKEIPAPEEKIFKYDGATISVKENFDVTIDGSFEVILPDRVKKSAFVSNHVFIVLADLEKSILLFNKDDAGWCFIARLEAFERQSLLNRRLHRIFISEDDIAFVFNNRIRKYNLKTGELICNKQVRGAKDKKYSGVDVRDSFMP